MENDPMDKENLANGQPDNDFLDKAHLDNYLESLLSFCLEKKCSPDDHLRLGSIEPLQPEEVFETPLPELYKSCKTRLYTVIQDLGDYGMRRDYTFPAGQRSPREEEEMRWLEGSFDSIIPPENRKKRVTRGRSEVTPPPFEPEVRRKSLGACLVALVESMRTDCFPVWLVRWLCLDMGYNLDWLLLGAGPMLAEWKATHGVEHSLPPSGTKYDARAQQAVYETASSLRERQALSLWPFTDWQWLHNLRAMVKTTYKAPTTPLLSRLTAWWRIPSQLPQMPNILAWIDWLSVWCAHEFIEGTPAEGWKQDIIEQLVTSRNSCLLILGLGMQSGGQYRLGKCEPTVAITRLAWLVRMAVDRRGREGFLQYLDLVNDEAEARGFEDLREIFEIRNWSSPDRPFRSKAVHSDDIEKLDLAGRNIPWGVPEEVKLAPLALIERIMDGSIPCDDDADIVWIPKKGSARAAAGSTKENDMNGDMEENHGA